MLLARATPRAPLAGQPLPPATIWSYELLNVQPGPIFIWFVAGDDEVGNFSSPDNFTRIPGLDKGRVGTQPRPLLFVVLVLEFIHFGVHILKLIRQFFADSHRPIPCRSADCHQSQAGVHPFSPSCLG
jgi:hypothetical protein